MMLRMDEHRWREWGERLLPIRGSKLLLVVEGWRWGRGSVVGFLGFLELAIECEVLGSVKLMCDDLASYEEEDDGFTFTRTKVKKSKAPTQEMKHQVGGSVEKESTPVKPKPSRRHKTFDTPIASEKVDKPRRRSGRLSGDDYEVDDVPRARAKAEKKFQLRVRDEDRSAGIVEPLEKPRSEETKIALPFSDTPVINRNKAMRTARASSVGGHRRSSIGLRGRRASSLIENGSIGRSSDTLRMRHADSWIRQPCLTKLSKPPSFTNILPAMD
jgi:hypothetical protein